MLDFKQLSIMYFYDWYKELCHQQTVLSYNILHLDKYHYRVYCQITEDPNMNLEQFHMLFGICCSFLQCYNL